MAKTYLQSISHFSEIVREQLIGWATRTRFEQVPGELSFLRPGFVDLGFENLGLSEEDHKALLLAFVGDGVTVPGTLYKLRYSGEGGATVVEIATGEEPTIPEHWKQGVFVVGAPDRLTWIGKNVRPDHVGDMDIGLYWDARDGWQFCSAP
jgi:hypothetical protein